MSPIPAMPAAAPYVSTTTTVAPVLPAVTATTETPATVQTPVLSAVTQPIEDKEAQVVAAATPVVFQVQSQVGMHRPDASDISQSVSAVETALALCTCSSGCADHISTTVLSVLHKNFTLPECCGATFPEG